MPKYQLTAKLFRRTRKWSNIVFEDSKAVTCAKQSTFFGPIYMVSGTREKPAPEITLPSDYMKFEQLYLAVWFRESTKWRTRLPRGGGGRGVLTYVWDRGMPRSLQILTLLQTQKGNFLCIVSDQIAKIEDLFQTR